MTPEEIGKILHMPFPKLAEHCKDPATLVAVISLAINTGIRLGQEQTHKTYHEMLAGYNEVSVRN